MFSNLNFSDFKVTSYVYNVLLWFLISLFYDLHSLGSFQLGSEKLETNVPVIMEARVGLPLITMLEIHTPDC